MRPSRSRSSRASSAVERGGRRAARQSVVRKLINPKGLPPPRGFTHGVLTRGGSLLSLAGQTGSDATGRIVAPGDVVAQFDQALRNITAVVEAAGGKPQDIVKLNIFVRNRDDYLSKLEPLGQVFRSRCGLHYPAMALFEVSGLFTDEALVELEGLAVIGSTAD